MASSISLVFPILLLILNLLLVKGETQTNDRITLTRVSYVKSRPRNKQYTQNALSNAMNGVKKPPSSQLKPSNDLYAMKLAIGTPPMTFSAIMDTGSSLIWTKCESSYFESTSYTKSNQLCKNLGLSEGNKPFVCKQDYQNDKSVSVTLGQDTFTLGNTKMSNVTFGCSITFGHNNINYDGIIGMGRGELSLVSYLEKKVFLYCLGSRFDTSKTSVLLIGSKATTAIENTKMQTMSLIERENKPYYYISLEGISIGNTRLNVTKSDFMVNDENGDGGMIIDSGATFTYLEKRVVSMIITEFVSQTKLKKIDSGKHKRPYDDLEYCFVYDTEIVPKMVFHFTGANWELPGENYMYKKNGFACLAIVANPDGEKVSIFGNMQQQNMMVVYDLEKNMVSFRNANCNEL